MKNFEKITKEELRTDFETHYKYKYKTDEEFEKAVYHEYQVEDYFGKSVILYGGDEPIVVTDWEN